MTRILAKQAQAWFDKTKLNIDALDQDLLEEIETETVGRLSSVFDTTSWTNETNTPSLVRTAIAKLYASWYYNRTYSEDSDELNDYAAKLAANAELLISGLIAGTITLPEAPADEDISGPSFYPTDESSVMEATSDDRSLGPNVFSMGTTF